MWLGAGEEEEKRPMAGFGAVEGVRGVVDAGGGRVAVRMWAGSAGDMVQGWWGRSYDRSYMSELCTPGRRRSLVRWTVFWSLWFSVGGGKEWRSLDQC